MDVKIGNNATAMAISGSAVGVALLEALVAKGVLSKAEARSVVQEAERHIAPLLPSTVSGDMAAHLLKRTLRRFEGNDP